MKKTNLGSPRRRKSRRIVATPFLLLLCSFVFALLLFLFSIHHVSSNVNQQRNIPLRNVHTTSQLDNIGRNSMLYNAAKTTIDIDVCDTEYQRLTCDRTHGLSTESIRRSRAWIGNRQRLDNLARNLTSGKDVHVVTFGGSITLGHGVARNSTPEYVSGPYGDLLERWLNEKYTGTHKVFNMAAHGADMCALEKRINGILADLGNKNRHPDLFILEFAVNDYQGQDHIIQVDSKTDVFFDGFQDIALCCEVVVHKLLRSFPQAAIVFLEFQTAITSRKTGAFLHSGVAQHYEIPVISYAEAMLPPYLKLVSMLNASDRYTVPKGETLMPYPYGCQKCNPGGIANSFNHFRPADKHCRSICDLQSYSGKTCDMFKSPPPGREYCHPAIFAVDAVHPSTVGHYIAKDLIVHAIASAARDRCHHEPFLDHILPSTSWLAGSKKSLEARSNFVDVRDTDCFLPFCKKLDPIRKTNGFKYYSDVKATNFEKFGWIASNPTGAEMIEFDISLPARPCYAVYVAVLRSYSGMGQFAVEVENVHTKKVTAVDLDGLWNAKISVWSDNQIVADDDVGACTGKCKVRIKTKPQMPDRNGNKVKILTLSARECIL